MKGWNLMSKFIAMLPDEGAAETITKKLSDLNIDTLDWNIVDDTNRTRLLPAFAWPSGSSGTAGAVAPVGGAFVAGGAEDNVLDNDGVDEGNADFFGQAIENGGTAIIVEAPDEYDDQVRSALQRANISRIVKE
jgi:hypothetical protein